MSIVKQKIAPCLWYDRVSKAFLQMKKFDIGKLQQAYAGN